MANGELSFTGAAMIGWVHATWPLARLTVTKDCMRLRVACLGHYTFSPEQVVSIEEAKGFFHGGSMRIRHNVASYPNKIFFRHFGNPAGLINRIQSTGFQAVAQIPATAERSSPVRWQAIVVLIALWNVLFALDLRMTPRANGQLGWFALLAFLLTFLGSVSMPRIGCLQRVILKPSRYLGEIKPWLNLLALVSGMMLLFFLVQHPST